MKAEELFKKHGCHGFWEEPYASLSFLTLSKLLKAKNDRRLDQLAGSLLIGHNVRKTKNAVTDQGPRMFSPSVVERYAEDILAGKFQTDPPIELTPETAARVRRQMERCPICQGPKDKSCPH